LFDLLLVLMNLIRVPLLLALMTMPSLLRAGTATNLHDDWRMQSACKIQDGGDSISSERLTTEGWLKAAVPSTVLAAQVAAGVLPDPYYGNNLRKTPAPIYRVAQIFPISPIPADSPYACGWWYRKAFTAPPSPQQNGRFWLHFGGINYRGEI